MKLKYRVKSLDEVDEKQRDLYIEDGSEFVLDVDGVKTQADVDKLTTALSKERDDHKKSKAKLTGFGERTPDQVAALAEELETTRAELELARKNGTAPKAEEIDALVERRANARLRPLQTQLENATKTLESVTGENKAMKAARLRELVVTEVRKAAAARDIGIAQSVLEDDDLDVWAERNFVYDEETGKVATKDGLTPRDSLLEMRANGKRSHWFGKTTGTGANGAGKTVDVFDKNPFARASFNATALGAIVKADINKAIRMAKAASKDGWDAMRFIPAGMRPKDGAAA